jgi:single-strand DNA-binding protein
MKDEELDVWQNSVYVVGRLSSEGEELILPSGDVLLRFRVVIPRPLKMRQAATKTTVDTLDCYVMGAALRKRVEKFEVGQVVELEGAIRRRFWKAGASVASRVEIEVLSIKKMSG